MSFVQLFPTYMLSLEFVLGFFHGIAKGGDCKVEFNQPSYWFHVKFACILAISNPVFRWKLCKGCVWECVNKFKCIDLASDLRLATHQNATHVKHIGRWRVRQLEHYKTKIDSLAWQLTRNSNLQLIPLTRLSRQNALFCRKVTFHIPHIPYYKYLYTHEM